MTPTGRDRQPSYFEQLSATVEQLGVVRSVTKGATSFPQQTDGPRLV